MTALFYLAALIATLHPTSRCERKGAWVVGSGATVAITIGPLFLSSDGRGQVLKDWQRFDLFVMWCQPDDRMRMVAVRVMGIGTDTVP